MLESFRYTYDELDENTKYPDASSYGYAYAKLLSESIRVTDDLFPKIKVKIDQTISSLNLEDNFEFFITSDNTNTNAYCISKNNCSAIIVMNSRLVDILSEDELMFVVGHEIGHHTFKHSNNLPDISKDTLSDLKYLHLDLQRKMELSCDRIGLLSVKDFNIAAKAIIKMVSGLGDKHIESNYKKYLSQLKELKNYNLIDEKEKTHNSWLLRMQALKLFSTSKEFNQYIGNDVSGPNLSEVDEIINNGLKNITGIDVDKIFKEYHQSAIAFIAADLLRDKLDLEDHYIEILSEEIDKKTISDLVKYMSGTTPKRFQIKVNEKIAKIETLPPSSRKKFSKILKSILRKCEFTHDVYAPENLRKNQILSILLDLDKS